MSTQSISTTHLILSTTFALLVGGCGGTSTGATSTSETTPPSSTPNGTTIDCQDAARAINTLERTRILSKDDYYTPPTKRSTDAKGSGGGSGGPTHNQGRACLQCHSFASGGTVFGDLRAPNNTLGASGYRIRIGEAGIFRSGNGVGNSYLSHFSGGSFTAYVIDPNGNVVNSSAAGTHDASRLDCNRCHTAAGANGAPGRITSFRTSAGSADNVPATTQCVSFTAHVMPLLTSQCKSCHGSNGRFSVSDALNTYENITALQGDPAHSAQYLLDKASNTISHGGGQILPDGSAGFTTLKVWISEGVQNN